MRALWLAAWLVLAPAAARATPALWLVQGPHTKIYLFGTFHILPHPVPWLEGKVRAAFDSADTLWLEADVGQANPGAMRDLMRQGIDPDTDLWTELPPASAKLFRAELQTCKISPELVASYKPWLAALMPTICAIMRQSVPDTPGTRQSQSGPEAVLTRQAKAAHKTLAYFETAAEQIGYLAGAPPAAQLAALRHAIDEAATGKDDFAGMEDDWAAGNIAAIDTLIATMRNSSAAEYQTLLADRNIRFAARIKSMLDSQGIAFIAIGAGHLAGPDSVQAQLAKAGIHAVLQ